MSVLQQIKRSNLSKQGKTNPSGIFEGTPANVAAVLRGSSVPITSPAIPPIQNPIDVVYEARPQPTYLEFLQAANKK
jgi:hypothetical protein